MIGLSNISRRSARRLAVGVCAVAAVSSFAYIQVNSVDEPTVLAFNEPTDAPVVSDTLPSDAAAAAAAIATDLQLEGDCASDDAFCVGVVTGFGRVDDGSMNELVWSTLEKFTNTTVGDGPHMQVDLVETARVGDVKANIELFLTQNYDLIITVGSDATDVTVDAATDYPDLQFLGVEQQPVPSLSNYAAIPGSEIAAGSAAVALAAEVSSTGVVGIVLPTTNNDAHDLLLEGATVAAAQAGVELVMEHQPTTRSGPAATWGPDLIQQMADEEADVIAVLGVADGVGLLEAVAANPEMLCIGHGSDRWEEVDVATRCLVTSVEIDVSDALIEAISALRNGEAVDGYLKAKLFFSEQRPLTDDGKSALTVPDLSESMASILPGS